MSNIEVIYLAGGCVWGVQEFLRYVPGIIETEAGRANGTSQSTAGPYDGYSECVRARFNIDAQSVSGLMPYFFEIIDPYSINQQGIDVGEKYRTGVYSENPEYLQEAHDYIISRPDSEKIRVEVLPLSNFVSSDLEHQDRLLRCPDDYCHIDEALLYKYR
jgi:peptide-methionine (S)-S-oxide reductase